MKVMVNWNVEFSAGEQTLSEMTIHRGVCQADSFSPLIFIIAAMLLSYILSKWTEGYDLKKNCERWTTLCIGGY